jgi:hypothetical protein
MFNRRARARFQDSFQHQDFNNNSVCDTTILLQLRLYYKQENNNNFSSQIFLYDFSTWTRIYFYNKNIFLQQQLARRCNNVIQPWCTLYWLLARFLHIFSTKNETTNSYVTSTQDDISNWYLHFSTKTTSTIITIWSPVQHGAWWVWVFNYNK